MNILVRSSKPLPPSQKADILRMVLLILSVAILVPMTDARSASAFVFIFALSSVSVFRQ
jgi:hypothetical protein